MSANNYRVNGVSLNARIPIYFIAVVHFLLIVETRHEIFPRIVTHIQAFYTSLLVNISMIGTTKSASIVLLGRRLYHYLYSALVTRRSQIIGPQVVC